MDDRELEAQMPALVELHNEPLDPNLVAAYVDGALPAAEHAAVEARLRSDPEAMLLVRALREEAPQHASVPWSLVAVAAALVIALGVWWALDDKDTEADLPARLTVAAAAHGFEPLSADELDVSGVTRGGAAWEGPLGLLLSPPKRLRWRNATGSNRAEVQLEGEALQWKKVHEGTSLDAPALTPGRYVVKLRPLDTLAGQEIKRVFEVACERTVAKHERALSQILDASPRDIAELVCAHYALRSRLYERARDHVANITTEDTEVEAARDAVQSYLDALAR